ncbi:hypothetical protein KBTX_02304 [wastewater metagenome]|uniref:site-specific DNA-methyltransferase (adenine-specific) n=2 Tax=unclassified sequences TaxID=12908 RepID=A0A5B8RGJ1_9ZZZZ|nr:MULTISPECIES: BREX-2 system adenine-specific DNA-methyltransferase PglX [Arhodomonas]QEA05975.1 hypothetical protein KBTEX_02304 [uncultured organism]
MGVELNALRRDLQQQVANLTDDLRERSEAVASMRDRLQAEYREARDSGRTAATYQDWREDNLTQSAVAWVLAGVFVRFLEDNQLLAEAFITGPGERARQARERRDGYFREHPTDTDRDYFLNVFETVGELPAMRELFDREHNPLWQLTPSGDAARGLWEFWRRVVPETGELVHDFTDPDWDTRFLGDLYEQLSERARKQFALLQTPEFVEEFILDRTLDPAIEDFGLEAVRLIDPTCGSGHFLIGAFHRLLQRWHRQAPAMTPRERIQKALRAVAGVDINPFAVSIARFRLLIAALQAEGIGKVKEAPAYQFELAAGDSLLHGLPLNELALDHAGSMRRHPSFGQAYRSEDIEALNRILGSHYHAVVGNPPYITVKDKAQNALYRRFYGEVCHRQYALTVPFTQRFFSLALPGGDRQPAGHTGMIIADSFMKREFGKKLVEQFLPRVNLTHVIHTAGAYIPGHGTPTVILFGSNRAPTAPTVRTVMGIRGEPGTPSDPARGQVWSAILDQVDQPGSESDFVSVADLERPTFAAHPWSLGGGSITAVKEHVEGSAQSTMQEWATSIGFVCITKSDEVFVQEPDVFRRQGVPMNLVRTFGIGEDIRDWAFYEVWSALFPYTPSVEVIEPQAIEGAFPFMWPYRTTLFDRKVFGGKTYRDVGKAWYEYGQIPADRFQIPRSITFAFVATHNHFVLDRGGKVFNRSAPVIKLPAEASEDDHLALLGLLNSSVACFWMKQVFHSKGAGGGSRVAAGYSAMGDENWESHYEFTGTGLKQFPVTETKPLDLARQLDDLATRRQAVLPDALRDRLPLSRDELDAYRAQAEDLLGRMIALQEEVDWRCYRLYGVLDRDFEYCDAAGRPQSPPALRLGERAFEIAMARRMAAGKLETSWFRRHGSTPITELPTDWPEDYRALVEARIEHIQSDRYIGLLEQPEHKRRWNLDSWAETEEAALRRWLLDRLEAGRYWGEPALQTTNDLADRAVLDVDFMAVAELYVGRSGVDVKKLVAELVADEAVPLLSVLRYKAAGQRKRQDWEATWALQRREDAIDAEVAAELTQGDDESDADFAQRLKRAQDERKRTELGTIPVPPKYNKGDFLDGTYWRLRGALDVPKERFVSLPHCSPDGDNSLLVGWAGWDSLQRMQAVAACYTDRRQQAGWPAERLVPFLAAMDELLPWVQQWHSTPDPEFGRMDEFFETYLTGQLQELGLTRDAIRQWQPPQTRRRGRKAQS